MKRTILLLCSIAALSATITSCHKEPLDQLSDEESRIYITNYDSTASFASYHTFTISDSVAVIDNNNSTRESSDVDRAFISAVRTYMTQRGYTEVSRSQKPDLGVNVNRIINTQTGIISYPDYWDYYGGYWDPYYYGYGGYDYYVPYAYSTYQVREGALSIDILDLKDASQNNQIGVIWTGLIRGSGINNSATANSQVKALFDQSPYLATND